MKIKITAIRKTEYKDLMAIYENPIEHACDIKEGAFLLVKTGKNLKNFAKARGIVWNIL